jgi:hypothetical protein
LGFCGRRKRNSTDAAARKREVHRQFTQPTHRRRRSMSTGVTSYQTPVAITIPLLQRDASPEPSVHRRPV